MATGARPCRARGAAGGREQGSAERRRAATPSIASLLGIRHAVLAVNKIDLIGFRQQAFDRDRGGLHDVRRAARLQGRSRRSRFRRARRQRVGAQRERTPGTPAQRCSIISKPSTSRTTTPPSRSACRCNGSVGRIPISAALPAPSPAAACGRATRLPSCRRDGPRPSSRSSSTAARPMPRKRAMPSP